MESTQAATCQAAMIYTSLERLARCDGVASGVLTGSRSEVPVCATCGPDYAGRHRGLTYFPYATA